MTREIKFRVWNPHSKDMSSKYHAVRVDGKLLSAASNEVYLETDTEKTNEVVMQFTGLKDKNGKEIYEGDIMTDGSVCNDAGDETVYSIGFSDGAYRIEKTNCTCGCIGTVVEGCMESKIIGNIYENPELLENKEI